MNLLIASLVLAAVPAQDFELPRNDGWVTDLAGILQGGQEQSLETLMESYKQGSGHDIAVLVIPGLEGQSLERYSLEVARGWGLGGKEAHDGALLLVSIEDRKLRIEVGRGLEGNLTDAISSRIIHDVIKPHFKQSDYYGGIVAGVRAMHAAIGGDYAQIEASRQDGRRGSSVAMTVFFLIFLLIHFLSARGRHRRYRSGGGSAAFWTWMAVSSMSGRGGRGGGLGGGGGGGFSGFGGGGGFSGGGSSGGW